MKRIVLWSVCLTLGIFFLASGILKLTDPYAFSQAISRYRMTPAFVSPALSLWIPWLEVAAGLAILWPSTRKAGAVLMAGLLLLFQVALLSALFRGLDIDCGCLGSGLNLTLGWALVRNLVLLGLVVIPIKTGSGMA